MTVRLSIIIDQGATFSQTFDVGMNVSTFTATSELRKEYTSTNSTNFTATMSGNTVTIAMNANTTTTLTGGQYVYDVKGVANTGDVYRLVEGIATVVPQVTE